MMTFSNRDLPKLQIPNLKQITMIHIQISKRFDSLIKLLEPTRALCRRMAEIKINYLTLEIENHISLQDRRSQITISSPVRKVGFGHWILGFEIYL